MGTVAVDPPSPTCAPSTKSSDVATLAQAPTVVGELHPDLVLPCREQLVAVHLELLQPEEVVTKAGLPSWA